MTDLRRQPDTRIGRSDRASEDDSPLPMTADATCGSSNLVTIPRAGNLSTDTRAGRRG
jgi:hypothetical protein